MSDIIPTIELPEIFLGFVAPIGADIAPTLECFKDYFSGIGYTIEVIHVTELFERFKNSVVPDRRLELKMSYDRYDTHIRYGNQLRKHFNEPAVLAISAAGEIARRRKNKGGDAAETVYLIHQFKRTEEIEIMRALYGRLFFQISVYSRRGARVEYLSRKFASSIYSADINSHRSTAESIIQIDENQSEEYYGQRVSKIFHDADFIVNNDLGDENVKRQVNRFCDLLFSSNAISPSKMEYGMYAAKAAALRTLDLSRQVGAAIFRPTGEIISMGSNEVPRAGGGTYWCDELFDDREFKRKIDSNDRRKMDLLREIVSFFVERDQVDDEINKKNLKQTQLMDALEYGRIVHAEMVAICDAARLGTAIKGAHLLTTTFPCHMCAKHIVAAGIEEVVFLEPYPKSLAFDLH